MKVLFAVLAILAITPHASAQPALGTASGSCTFDKKPTVKFVDGVALPGHSFFDDSEPATAVYLSTSTLSAFRPDDYVDPVSGLNSMTIGPGKAMNIITVTIDKNGKLESVGPRGSYSTGFGFSGGAVKNGRISGKLSGTGGARDESACEVTFDVPLLGVYGPGKSLPADGGEPGGVMRALWSSLQNEDSAATLDVLAESLVDPARKGTMPNFVLAFGRGNGNKVVGGRLFGPTRAILDLDFGTGPGRALMLKQSDRWRIQDVSFD